MAGRTGSYRIINIAQPMLAHTRSQARTNVRSFYRSVVRNMPTILQMYELPDVNSRDALKNLKKEYFVPNLAVDNLETIEKLRYVGQQELQEALNLFKTKSHVALMCISEEDQRENERPPQSLDRSKTVIQGQSKFMDDFLA